MTFAEHLLENPAILHGPLRIAFTCDEEIGRGVDENLVRDFGANFAYTLDGSERGTVEYESFSADGATIRARGSTDGRGVFEAPSVGGTPYVVVSKDDRYGIAR